MTDHRPASSGWITPTILAVVLAVGLVCLAGFSIWMAHSDWNMRGHMGQMMGNGGRDTSGGQLTTGGTETAVAISDYAFSPGNLRVPVGATVTWTNDDDVPHNATARGRQWETPSLSKGESAPTTFNEPGDYTYYCTIHPQMVARLVVR